MAIHLGPGFPTSLHRHFAVQICLGLDKPLLLRTGKHGAWHAYTAALIPSGVWHQTVAQPVHLAMVYLDPLSALTRTVCALTGGLDGIRSLPFENSIYAIERLQTVGDHPDTIRETIQQLPGVDDHADLDPIDARVALARSILEQQADQLPTLQEIARQVGLSPHRFRHLFRAEMGIPYSSYRLWNRVVYAARLLATKPDLTWAAHKSGFADSAHFSRTFHRAFGLRPSAIFKSGEFRLVLCG